MPPLHANQPAALPEPCHSSIYRGALPPPRPLPAAQPPQAVWPLSHFARACACVCVCVCVRACGSVRKEEDESIYSCQPVRASLSAGSLPAPLVLSPSSSCARSPALSLHLLLPYQSAFVSPFHVPSVSAEPGNPSPHLQFLSFSWLLFCVSVCVCVCVCVCHTISVIVLMYGSVYRVYCWVQCNVQAAGGSVFLSNRE